MPMAFQPPMKPIVPVPDFSAAAAPARKDASCSRNTRTTRSAFLRRSRRRGNACPGARAPRRRSKKGGTRRRAPGHLPRPRRSPEPLHPEPLLDGVKLGDIELPAGEPEVADGAVEPPLDAQLLAPLSSPEGDEGDIRAQALVLAARRGHCRHRLWQQRRVVDQDAVIDRSDSRRGIDPQLFA